MGEDEHPMDPRGGLVDRIAADLFLLYEGSPLVGDACGVCEATLETEFLCACGCGLPYCEACWKRHAGELEEATWDGLIVQADPEPRRIKATMARQRRNSTEIEADRLYILKLLMGGGAKMDAIQVAQVLNEKRAAGAREVALVLGKSKEEAEQAAKDARVSVETVRRDIRIVESHLKEGKKAGSAAYLDEQLAEIAEQKEKIYALDEALWEEINRAHNVVQTKGVPGKDSKGRPTITTTEITRQSNKAAPASLFRALQQNVRLLERLRAEERRLRWGILWFRHQSEEENFSQALLDLDDPEKAREAAIEIYNREIEALTRAESIELTPLSPEMARAERIRNQRLASRAGRIKKLISDGRPDIPANPTGSDQRKPYELVVKRVNAGG